MRIRRQLTQTPGLVGYALNAQLARKTFWTFSVWDVQASIDAFAAANPHQGIIRALQPRMEKTSFEFFQLTGSALPLTWEQMKAPVNPLRDQKE